MFDMDNIEFAEISTNIKEEFVDDKIFVNETTFNIHITELNENGIDDKIKLGPISPEIKQELSSDVDPYNIVVNDMVKIEDDVAVDTKIEFNNKQLFCNNCNEYYKEYCTKCGMLICILNKKSNPKEIPKDILELRDGLFRDAGVFSLKTIPKGVKFGPYSGPGTPKSFWKLKRGKLEADNRKSEFSNWMQFINSTRSVSEQNLYAFQYDDNLYYRSIREIQKGEELLVHFGEEYEESLNNGIEMDFIPIIEEDVKNIFACAFCCLGFSSETYLVEHKTLCCSNEANGIFEELLQCPYCKIYMEKNEYLECHKSYCWEEYARRCVLPELDDHTLEEKRLSFETGKLKRRLRKYRTTCKDDHKHHINEHYDGKTFRCGICYKRFKTRESFKLHVKTIHVAIKQKEKQKSCVRRYQKTNIKNKETKILNTHYRRQFDFLNCKPQTNSKYTTKTPINTKNLKERAYKCMECEFKTNYKLNLKRHITAKHLKEKDYNCIECEFKTDTRVKLKRHIKVNHRKERDYKCIECKYQTNYKQHLNVHIKTIHLKQKDYKCMECEYKTNSKAHLARHTKTRHLKEKNLKCMECEYKTNDKSHLKSHIKNKHCEERDYKCMDCKFKTNYKSKLEKHIKIKHLKEHDFKCAECEYQTNYKFDLKKHVKNKHLKDWDFECRECEFKTGRKSDLKNHIKNKHLKERDYKCKECDYQTNFKSCLEKHIKTKHLKTSDYKCMECEYQTNYKSCFVVHLKTKHFKESNFIESKFIKDVQDSKEFTTVNT